MENRETLETLNCPSCHGTYEEGSRFCNRCGTSIPAAGKKRSMFRKILLGGMALIVLSGVLFLWMEGAESGLAGKVNGEGISREDFSRRLDRAKKVYESRYGQTLFDGPSGKENLNRLKSDVLEEMIVEKILLQEAKNAGFASAPEDEIEKQVQAIKTEHRLTEADIKKMTGGGLEEFRKELRKEWLISQFIEKAVLKKEDQTRAEIVFGDWLAKAKARARIETYEKLGPVSTAGSSCCKTGCGGGGTQSAQPLDAAVEKEAKARALEYYEKKTRKKGASARVTNFGCHVQVDVIEGGERGEGGKVVFSLTYQNGEVREI